MKFPTAITITPPLQFPEISSLSYFCYLIGFWDEQLICKYGTNWRLRLCSPSLFLSLCLLHSSLLILQLPSLFICTENIAPVRNINIWHLSVNVTAINCAASLKIHFKLKWLFYWLCFGTHLVVLKAYLWHCTQGWILTGLRRRYVDWSYVGWTQLDACNATALPSISLVL